MTNQTQTPLKVFLGTAFPPPEKIDRSEEETLRLQIADLNDQIRQLKGIKRSQFLPYEATAILAAAKAERKKLEASVRTINVRLAGIKEEQRLQEMHIYMAQMGYPEQLDLTPLTMANKHGDPAFMVSPVNNRSGVCEISGRREFSGEIKIIFKPKLPQAIADKLIQAVNHSVKASFAGYADNPEVRREIEKAKKTNLFDEILVIAEAPEWTRIGGDPIIAGWVEETKQLFFITAYDMTPLEEYFKNQFAFGVTIPKK